MCAPPTPRVGSTIILVALRAPKLGKSVEATRCIARQLSATHIEQLYVRVSRGTLLNESSLGTGPPKIDGPKPVGTPTTLGVSVGEPADSAIGV